MKDSTTNSFSFPCRIGLGMAALGRPGYINLGHANDLNKSYDINEMEKHAFSVLDEAHSLGIKYFDVARSYGKGEEFLGNWLKQRFISTDDVFVGSKWGYTYTANWQVKADHHEIKEHSISVLKKQLNQSTINLNGYLGLYQIHSATFESGVLDNKEVLRELLHIKEQGLRIGLTTSGPKQGEVIRKALDIHFDGQLLFDSVQSTWNLLERSAAKALAEAFSVGLFVIIKEGLANGRLTERNEEPDFQDKIQIIKLLAKDSGVSVDAFALGAALAQPWAGMVLSGASTVEQVRSNFNALTVEWNKEIDESLLIIEEEPKVYWKKRSSLQWN